MFCHKLAWTHAVWKVDRVDVNEKRVKLVRVDRRSIKYND
jgi:hypothetical protein